MAAPVFSRQKRPSNFDLRFLPIITIEPCGSDDLLSVSVDRDKRSAGFQRFSEKILENMLVVTIPLGVLLPDERIRRDRKQLVPIVRCERPQLDQFASQMWLKIEPHCICEFRFDSRSHDALLR